MFMYFFSPISETKIRAFIGIGALIDIGALVGMRMHTH